MCLMTRLKSSSGSRTSLLAPVGRSEGAERGGLAVRSAAGLPTASIVVLVAGSAPPASRPSGPCGAALRAGLDPGSSNQPQRL